MSNTPPVHTISQFVKESLNKHDKIKIGQITKIHNNKLADIQFLEKRLIKNEQHTFPIVQKVPLLHLTNGVGGGVLVPYKEGDQVLVCILDALDYEKAVKKNVFTTLFPHNLANAVVIGHFGNEVDAYTYNNEDIVIYHKDGKVTISSNGKIEIKSGEAEISLNTQTGLIGIKNDTQSMLTILMALITAIKGLQSFNPETSSNIPLVNTANLDPILTQLQELLTV